jgi:hypothetical protein
MLPHSFLRAIRISKPAALLLAFLAFAFTLSAVGFMSSTVQTPQQEGGAERELKDEIPKHVPIQVKVKNLKNDKWTDELEVEVKNTGDKPIYFLYFTLFFVDVKIENGDDIAFPFRYGRADLASMDSRATPDDVPIHPGETYLFKAPKSLANNWEKFRVSRNFARPKKIGLRFHHLSHGDGTGFRNTGGTPYPRARSSNSTCGSERQPATPYSPVSFLPASFFTAIADKAAPNSSPPQSGLCCPSTSCFYLRTNF